MVELMVRKHGIHSKTRYGSSICEGTTTPVLGLAMETTTSDYSTEPVEDTEITPPEVLQSCIGAKRRCTHPLALIIGGDDTEVVSSKSVSPVSCSKSLADFQTYCRDNKKLNQCIATDWLVIYLLYHNNENGMGYCW